MRVKHQILLKKVLWVNSFTTIMFTFLLFFLSKPIATLMGGYPAWVLRVIAIGLLGFAALVAWTAYQKQPSLLGLVIIVVGDWGWVLGSIILVLWNPLPFTAIGIGMIIGVAILVAAYAYLETICIDFEKTKRIDHAPAN